MTVERPIRYCFKIIGMRQLPEDSLQTVLAPGKKALHRSCSEDNRNSASPPQGVRDVLIVG